MNLHQVFALRGRKISFVRQFQRQISQKQAGQGQCVQFKPPCMRDKYQEASSGRAVLRMRCIIQFASAASFSVIRAYRKRLSLRWAHRLPAAAAHTCLCLLSHVCDCTLCTALAHTGGLCRSTQHLLVRWCTIVERVTCATAWVCTIWDQAHVHADGTSLEIEALSDSNYWMQ